MIFETKRNHPSVFIQSTIIHVIGVYYLFYLYLLQAGFNVCVYFELALIMNCCYIVIKTHPLQIPSTNLNVSEPAILTVGIQLAEMHIDNFSS